MVLNLDSLAWALHYSFPPPVSPRVFTEHLLIHLDDSDPSKRIGSIIQFPFDLAGSTTDVSILDKEGKDVKGKYASIEQIREQDGQIEWRYVFETHPHYIQDENA